MVLVWHSLNATHTMPNKTHFHPGKSPCHPLLLNDFMKRLFQNALHRIFDRWSDFVLDPTYQGWVTHEGAKKTSSLEVEPTPKPSTPQNPWHVWTKPLGLVLNDGDAIVCTRHNQSITLDLKEEDAHTTQWTTKRMVWSSFLAARLILDATHINYKPTMERAQTPDKVWRKEDIPVEHGERYPWFVPNEVLDVYQKHTGQALWATTTQDPQLSIIYVQEYGKSWHAMTCVEAQSQDLPQDKLANDARRALFYQSYRIKPCLLYTSPSPRD